MDLYPADIHPATDDWPFFFQFYYWSFVWGFLRGENAAPPFHVSVLFLTGLISLGLLVMVFLPVIIMVNICRQHIHIFQSREITTASSMRVNQQ